jgi:hypothetical protein
VYNIHASAYLIMTPACGSEKCAGMNGERITWFYAGGGGGPPAGYGRRTPRRLRLRLLAMDGLTERRATLRAALAFLALEPREPERRLLHRGREAAAGGAENGGYRSLTAATSGNVRAKPRR